MTEINQVYRDTTMSSDHASFSALKIEIEVEIRAVFDFAPFVVTDMPLNQVVSRLAFRSLTWKNSIPKR